MIKVTIFQLPKLLLIVEGTTFRTTTFSIL